MALGDFDNQSRSAPMAEINMVPLIDVMLVLLVIFIITAPLLTHAVKIDLPRAASHPNPTRADNVQLAITAEGAILWNGEAVGREELRRRMAAAGKLEPRPELHLRVERTVQYQAVAEVMADAAKAGISRIGFVTDPRQAQ